MKKLPVIIGLAVAYLFTPLAFAQTKGEADAEQAKAVQSKKATPAEKAAARQARVAEGKTVAKTHAGGEGPSSAGAAKVATAEEKKVAASKRKAAATEAVKKGQTTSGEK